MARLCVTAVICGLVVSALASDLDGPEKPDIRRILSRHDQYRTLTKASDMIKLSWSENLEKLAAKAVASCPQSVAAIRSALPDGLRHKGVNMGVAPYPPRLIDGYPEDIQTSIVDQWGGERANFYTDSGCPSEPCDAWWQVVWSKASRIGCSLEVCGNASVMACIYNRRGDPRADLPYKAGDSCTACPPGFSECRARMCIPDIDQQEDQQDKNEGTGAVKGGEDKPIVSVSDKDPSLIVVDDHKGDPIQPKAKNPSDDGDGAGQLSLFTTAVGLVLLQLCLLP